jgi:hypothetical protein
MTTFRISSVISRLLSIVTATILLLSTLNAAAAQDTTPTIQFTETPTNSATETQTDTPTEVPTEVPSETPTAIPTDPPTEAPTGPFIPETDVEPLAATEQLIEIFQNVPLHVAIEERNPHLIFLQSGQLVPPVGLSEAETNALDKPKPSAETNSTVQHVLIQFEYMPSDDERNMLLSQGIQLLDYIPYNTWIAGVTSGGTTGTSEMILQADKVQPGLIRWVGPLKPADKVSPEGYLALIESAQLTAQVNLSFFADTPAEIERSIIEAVGALIIQPMPDFHLYAVEIDVNQIAVLATYDAIAWIEPTRIPSTDNDGARIRTGAGTLWTAPYNLNGAGVQVGEWDGGQVYPHTDLSGRLTIAESSSTSDHASHVAGTIAGNGALSASQGGSSNQWAGMAPQAAIVSYNYFGTPTSEHNAAINTYGIDLSQNSWGWVVYGTNEPGGANCGSLFGAYDSWSRSYDQIITGLYGRRIPIVFAAGNARRNFSNGGYPVSCNPNGAPNYANYNNLPGPGGNAKNVITVGASNSNDDSMTSFSSWGPMDDGRIKPDVVAPGCQNGGDFGIKSTFPNNTYGVMCGTSMAAPVVSGISTLLIQQFRASYNIADPLPSTIKAALIHGADDLNDGTSWYNPGPDFASGYGRVNAVNSANLIKNRQIVEDAISHQATDTYDLNVVAGQSTLKITLAWDDPAASANASFTLVNDVDLWLVAPNGAIYYPWRLDPNNPSQSATVNFDGTNNVEQVSINNPMPGQWKVIVYGWNIPVAPQSYSIVLSSGWFGSAAVTANRNVVAVGRPHVGSEIATYGGINNGATNVFFPMVFKNQWDYNSALTLQNTSTSSTANFTITFRDAVDGSLDCTKTDALPANGSITYWIPTLSCNSGSLASSWYGAAVIQSTNSVPLAAVTRPHLGSEVTAYNGFTSGANSAFLPMLFKNQSGNDSAFYVQNLSNSATANISMKFVNADGSVACTATDTIAAFSSKGYWVPTQGCASGSLPGSWAGAVVVTADQQIVAVGRPHIGAQVTTYNGFLSGTTTVYVPMLFKNQWSYNSALYIQNTNGSSAANLTITFRDVNGNLNCTKTDTLPAHAAKGYWIPDLSCNTGSLPSSWYGSVVVQSSQPVVATARPHLIEQVTTYNGFPAGSTQTYLPMLFANSGGNDAAVYVQNLDSQSANVTLRFYRSAGTLSCTITDTIAAFSSKGYWVRDLPCTP